MNAIYATHCDGLVLGVGVTPEIAENDAVLHGAELDDCDTRRITPRAANHVRNGGDCRGLKLHRDDNPDEDLFCLPNESVSELQK